MLKVQDKSKLNIIFLSFLFAFWMCIPAINDFISVTLNPSFSSMTLLYAGVGVLLLFELLRIYQRNWSKFLIIIFFLLFVGVLYSGTYILEKTNLKLERFIVFFMFPLLFSPLLLEIKKDSYKYLFFFIATLPFGCVLFLNKIFELNNQSVISMGSSYNFLTPVLGCLTFLFFYFKKAKNLYKILFIPFIVIDAIFLIKIFSYGSRGPILCVFSLLLICCVFKYDTKKEKIEFRGAWAIVAIVLFLLFAMYFWEILEFASKYINSNFINKMLKLRAEQNVSNNREDLYALSFNLIPNHPIFGHGISSFAFYTGEVYPHNLFVQLLFDGGIVLFLLVVIPLLSLVLKLFKKCDFELVPIFTFLFSISFVKSMVSGNIWENDKLWFLIGISMMMFHFTWVKYQGTQKVKGIELNAR